MKKIDVIATHYSDDKVRNAVILNVDGVYVVDKYENGVLYDSTPFPNKSIHWAESVAENYCLRITDKHKD
jgi:hypothetical protein